MERVAETNAKKPETTNVLVDARQIWTEEKLNNILNSKSITEPRVIHARIDPKSGAGNHIVIGRNEVYRITKFTEGDAYTEGDFRLDSPVIIAGLQEEDPLFLDFFPKILGFAKADITYAYYAYRGKKPRIVLYPVTDAGDYSDKKRVFTTIVEKFDPRAGWEFGLIGNTKRGGFNALERGDIDVLTIKDILLESRNALKAFASLTNLQAALSRHGMILEDIKSSIAVRKDPSGNIIEFKILDIDDLIRKHVDIAERERLIISWMNSPGESFPFDIKNIARHMASALQRWPELAQQKEFKAMLYAALQLELAYIPAYVLKRAGIKFQQLSLAGLRDLAAKACTSGLDTELEDFTPGVFVKVLQDEANAIKSNVSMADVLGREATERATPENFRALLSDTYHLASEVITSINLGKYSEAAKLLEQIPAEKEVELVPKPIQWFLKEADTKRMMEVFMKGNFKYSDTIEDLFLLFAQPIYPGLPTYTRGNLENITRLAQAMNKEGMPLLPEFFRELATKENVDDVLRKYRLI